jgi:hypothetical protein
MFNTLENPTRPTYINSGVGVWEDYDKGKIIKTYQALQNAKKKLLQTRIKSGYLKIIKNLDDEGIVLNVIAKNKKSADFFDALHKQLTNMIIKFGSRSTKESKERLKKKSFISIKTEYNKLMQDIKTTKNLMEERIEVKTNTVKQNDLFDLPQDEAIKYGKLFSHFYPTFTALYHRKLYSRGHIMDSLIKFKYIFGGIEQFFITGGLNGDGDSYVKHETNSHQFGPNINLNDLRIKPQNFSSEHIIIDVIGWWVVVRQIRDTQKINLAENDAIYSLRAYNGTNNTDFHKMSLCSTSFNKVCIYESYLHLTEELNLHYRRKNKPNRDQVNQMLKDEGKEIEDAVKKGELIKALELLTAKDETKINIVYFDSRCKQIVTTKEVTQKFKGKTRTINKKIIGKKIMIGKYPIIVDKGVTRIADMKDVNKMLNKQCLLYEENKHVAPFLFEAIEIDNSLLNIPDNNDENATLIKNDFVLQPVDLLANFEQHYGDAMEYSEKPLGGVLAWDFETWLDGDRKSQPQCVTIYGHLTNEISGEDEPVSIKMYGLDCIDQFLNYMASIITVKNQSKSKAKKAIPWILMYGYNNSNYDNLLIWEKLFEMDNSTTYTFSGNQVKCITYNNIKIYDIGLFYNECMEIKNKEGEIIERVTGLRGTCMKFGFEEEKGVFPYEFLNRDNLNYVGPVPERKFWNSDKDYETYFMDGFNKIMNKNMFDTNFSKALKYTDEFNVKQYSLKYCLLDSQLTYKLAIKHLSMGTGEITLLNGQVKMYDLRMAMTSANLSLKVYEQVFQKKPLHQSPDDIVAIEEITYKGGRTEVFKKEYYEEDNGMTMIYVDINSAHPSGMTLMMPDVFKNRIKFNDRVIKYGEIVDSNSYLAKSEYKGQSKYVIPNLLIRKNGHIIATLNTDYSYHWGIELKESILDGFEITVKEELIYDPEYLFDEFANYFYNERLKVKKTNSALGTFYKTIINSLYGKFGQKFFDKNVVVKDLDDFFKDYASEYPIITNFQVFEDKLMISYKKEGDESTKAGIGKLVRFSSYIAATTRCKLAQMMRVIGHENVYYCDTDSVFGAIKKDDIIHDKGKYIIKNPKLNDLIDDKILGKWKIECEPIEAIFNAPKFYCYKKREDGKVKEEIKTKGAPSRLFTYDELLQLQNGEIETITKNVRVFNRSLSDGIHILKTDKSIKTVYNKRKWTGNESVPFDNIVKWEKNTDDFNDGKKKVMKIFELVIEEINMIRKEFF